MITESREEKKMRYEEPTLEVMVFKDRDIVTLSEGSSDDTIPFEF